MNRIQKFDTFLKEIYVNHTNKSLIEGVIDAFTAIFEGDSQDAEAGQAGVGASKANTYTRQDRNERFSPGTYGRTKQVGKDSLITDSGLFGPSSFNSKVNDFEDLQQMYNAFSDITLKTIGDSYITEQFADLEDKQSIRPTVFTQADLDSLGVSCFRIEMSGREGLVQAQNASKGKVINHGDVAKILASLNKELLPFFTEAKDQTDEEVGEPIKAILNKYKTFLKRVSDASYSEVTKALSAFNEGFSSFKPLTEKDAENLGIDSELYNMFRPYFQLKEKYTRELEAFQKLGATMLGNDTDNENAILAKLTELGIDPKSPMAQEVLATINDIKNRISSRVYRVAFKNAPASSKEIGPLYNAINKTAIKWEDLYSGSGKAQSLISNFRDYINSNYKAKLQGAVSKFAEAVKNANIDPFSTESNTDESGKIQKPAITKLITAQFIDGIPTKFVMMCYAIIKSNPTEVGNFLKTASDMIVGKSGIDDKTLKEAFDSAKESIVSSFKNDTLEQRIAKTIDFDANAYKKLIKAKPPETDAA